MHADSSWPTTVGTRARSSNTSGTDTFSTRCVTPTFRKVGSRTGGRTEAMTVAEFRGMIEGQNFEPFAIETKGGRVYRVPHRSSYWFPEEFEGLVIVAVRGQGIRVLD